MSVSRRKFLTKSAIAAAAFVAAPLPAAWSGVHQPSPDVTPSSHIFGKTAVLDRHAFEQAVGSHFQVSSKSGDFQPVWLTLLAVSDLPAIVPINPASMAVPPPKTFTSVTTVGYLVTFNSSAEPLPQGVYTFKHDVLGTFDLLIVPESHAGTTYTAVFNTLSSTAAMHFRPPRPNRPVSGVPTGNSVKSAGGGSGADGVPASLPGGPAEQQMEPGFRDRAEPKLPE